MRRWLCLLVLLPPFLFAADSARDYAGSTACQKCHAAEFVAQSASAHARALVPSQPPQPGDWAFGAGTQAITFVRRLDNESYLEEGLSWYRALNGYARTPGHKNSAGVRERIFDPSASILRCFACHSTGPLRISSDASGNRAIVPGELGVRCEVCHGAGAAHSREPARYRPRNPGRFSAEELNRFCGDCHRMPTDGGDTPNLRDPWNARHQPLLLTASACFQRSNGRLSCLTCHSPHAPLERKLEAYSAACDRCHSAPRHKIRPAQRPCVACHMPGVQAQPNLVFANHRIAVYSQADAMSPISGRR